MTVTLPPGEVKVTQRRDYKDGRVALWWRCERCGSDGYVCGSEDFALGQVTLMEDYHKCPRL